MRWGGAIWVAAFISVFGCGDEELTGDATTPDAAVSDADVGPPDASGAPYYCESTEERGECCYRASNADRPDSPRFRVTYIDFETPAAVADGLLQQVLEEALRSSLLEILIELRADPDAPSMTFGPGISDVRDGMPVLRWAAGDAPEPGAAERWDPITAPASLEGESHAVEFVGQSVSVPVADDDGTLVTELPVRQPRIEIPGLAGVPSCVGYFDTEASEWVPGATVGFFARVDETMMADVGLFGTTVCTLFAAADCETTPRAEWPVQPNATCDADGVCARGGCTADECDAFFVGGSVVLSGVEIQ